MAGNRKTLFWLAPLLLVFTALLTSPRRAESLFTAWSLQNGLELNGISFRPSPFGGIGVFAERRITRNERVMCVPKHLILNDEFVTRSSLSPVFREFPGKADAIRVLFVARMLYDRGAEPYGARKLGAYFDLWPDPGSLPITWSREEREAVELEISVESDVKEALEIVHRFPSVFKNRQAYSRENIVKALALVNSRAFGPVGTGGAFSKKNLIPGLDSFNHDPRPNRPKRILSFDEREVCIAPGADVEAGEEIFNDYGYDGSNFWALYGFLPPDGSDKTEGVSYLFRFRLKYPAAGSFAQLAFPEDPSLILIRATEAKLAPTLTPWVRLSRGLEAVDPEDAADPKLWDDLACLSPAKTGCAVDEARDARWVKEYLEQKLAMGNVQGSEGEARLLESLQAQKASATTSKLIQAAQYRRSLKQMIERVLQKGL